MPILTFPFKYPSSKEVSDYDKKNDKNDQTTIDIPLKEMIRTMSFKGVYLNDIIGAMIGLMMIGVHCLLDRCYCRCFNIGSFS
ncbi:MAG: hypothetical protein Q8T08_25505 [Ignavibacteria bacterium]|nr:hypothetical protein [Ignavibacteria bacterium]